MRRAVPAAALKFDAAQYSLHKATFQGTFAEEFLGLSLASGLPTLAQRLRSARQALDVGCGEGSHTRRMAGLMRPESLMMGLDPSTDMIAFAQRSLLSPAPPAGAGAGVEFVAADVREWGRDAGYCKHDLVTSFMALHWVPKPQLPEVLRGIRLAMVSPHPEQASEDRAWFVASHHAGPRSMQLLFDAVTMTIENGGPVGETAPPSVSSSSLPPWQECFPNGTSDWVPITMLPAAQWRVMLHDAGFDVGPGEKSGGAAGGSCGGNGSGVVRERVVETTYADAAGAYERYAAAWGPMFPTLPTTPLRRAFFRDVAATAAHLGSTAREAYALAPAAESSSNADGDGGHDRAGAGIVVRSLMVDIAVPARLR